MLVSKYFKLQELVTPEVYKKEGEDGWNYLTSDLIESLDGLHEFLHEKFERPEERLVIVINDWLWGGQYKESGYRVPDTLTGAQESQHKKGNAVDIKVRRILPERVQKAILENKDDLRLAKITRMEANPPSDSWTHVDCARLVGNRKRIYVFVP